MGSGGPRNPGRLTGCHLAPRCQLSRRRPGSGGGAMNWGRFLRVSGHRTGHCPKATRLPVLWPSHRPLVPV